MILHELYIKSRGCDGLCSYLSKFGHGVGGNEFILVESGDKAQSERFVPGKSKLLLPKDISTENLHLLYKYMYMCMGEFSKLQRNLSFNKGVEYIGFKYKNILFKGKGLMIVVPLKLKNKKNVFFST